ASLSWCISRWESASRLPLALTEAVVTGLEIIRGSLKTMHGAKPVHQDGEASIAARQAFRLRGGMASMVRARHLTPPRMTGTAAPSKPPPEHRQRHAPVIRG